MNARSLPTARLLMCRPQHFAVAYTINPWMDPRSWAQHDCALTLKSQKEWARLQRTLIRLGAQIELVTAVPELPDLVFTANAAVVLNGGGVLARFRHAQRAGEEPPFRTPFPKLAASGLVKANCKRPDAI